MIFLLNDLQNLVPAILHIHLGIVLDLYEMLEQKCVEIDDQSQTHQNKKKKEKAKIKREIKSLSQKLIKIQEKMIEVSSSVIDLDLIKDHFLKMVFVKIVILLSHLMK